VILRDKFRRGELFECPPDVGKEKIEQEINKAKRFIDMARSFCNNQDVSLFSVRD
jgi:hypothetical protein